MVISYRLKKFKQLIFKDYLNIFALFFSSFLLAACSQPLPPAAEKAVIKSFNPNEYLGAWYEIARLDNRFEKGLEQVTANYSLNDDGTIKVINRGYNPIKKEWKEAIGKAKFVDMPNADGTRTGRLAVSFFGPFYGDYNILELDKPYYNYALVSGGQGYLWILSRTPQLTYPVKQHLIAKAKELGYATEQLLFVKQANQVEYESGRHVIPQHN